MGNISPKSGEAVDLSGTRQDAQLRCINQDLVAECSSRSHIFDAKKLGTEYACLDVDWFLTDHNHMHVQCYILSAGESSHIIIQT